MATGIIGLKKWLLNEVTEAVRASLGDSHRTPNINVVEMESRDKPSYKEIDVPGQWSNITDVFDIKVTIKLEVTEANKDKRGGIEVVGV